MSLAQDLSLLETRGLLRVTMDPPHPIVRFKHALTREATYNSILQARRAELHRAAAETLTAFYPQPDLELVLTIADHWQRANQDARALETLLPRAQNLIYTGRSTSLTELLTRLNRSALSDSQQRDLDSARADAHAARGEYQQARGLYERALTQTASDLQRAQLLYGIGAASYHLNDNTRAIESQRASLALARELGNIKLQARASGGLGLAYWNLGDYENAQAHLLQSRSLGLEIGDSIELANAEYNLAGMLLDRADFQSAIRHAETAAQVYERQGHLPLAVRAMQLIGACYYGLKDLAQAAYIYQQAIRKSRDLGDNIVIALGLGNLAEVYTDWNELSRAASAYEEAIQQLQTTRYDSLLSYYLASLASIQIRQAVNSPSTQASQSLELAEPNVTSALALATRIHSQEDKGLAMRVFAELAMARGDLDKARESAREAVKLLQPLGRALELERAIKVENEIQSAIERSGPTDFQKEVSQ